jgi:uncharacterized protein
MFPLGSVLFPGTGLPLHVFEERYRQLVRDCLAGEPEFGVVLIERGSEVGGDDVRTDLGTVARIIEATELPDGRWALGCIGLRRIRVTAWHDDAPYPRAEVVDLAEALPGPGYTASLDAAVSVLRRTLALKAELGEAAVAATVELLDDPLIAGYQAAAAAPLGPLDQQRLLGVDDPDKRVTLLRDLLTDAAELLEARLAG